MKFIVVWKATAEAQLAELWMTATDRKAIREAADEIEIALRADPSRSANPVMFKRGSLSSLRWSFTFKSVKTIAKSPYSRCTPSRLLGTIAPILEFCLLVSGEGVRRCERSVRD